MAGTMRNMAVCTAVSLAVAAGCSSKPDGKVVAEVGDEAITLSEFEATLESLPPQWQARAKTPSGREQILEHQVRQRLIQLEAEDRGIDQRPDVKYQIDQAVQRILLQELMKEWQKEFEIPEDELKAYFAKNEEEFNKPLRFRAQHILVKVSTEAPQDRVDAALAKAKQAKQRVDGGEDFDAVARDMSQGPSKDKGGDLGYVQEGRFHPKFEEVALALEPGEISDPVRTPFGWHVIKLIDVDEPSEQTFADVRDELRKKLMPRKRQQAFESFMDSLKDEYTVQIHKDALSETKSAKDAGAAESATAAE